MRSLLVISLFVWVSMEFSHAKAPQKVSASDFSPCEELNLEAPTNALDMATLMGHYHIFNVPLLSRYEDEAIFQTGEVLVVSGKNRWPEALMPFEKKGDTYFYQFLRKRQVLAIRYKNKSPRSRDLASGQMKLFEVDRCALKNF